jgi:hypothetical protein
MALLRIKPAFLALLLVPCLCHAQEVQEEQTPPPEAASKPPVTITFTPPALEGRIVLGIFDEKGGLRRTLDFEPGSPDLKIDTNGYIVQWDGRDATDKPCEAGRYSARGYVVGKDVRIEGESFHFNDWMAEDQIPAQAVRLRSWGSKIGVELKTASGDVLREVGADGDLVPVEPTAEIPTVVPAQIQVDPTPIASAVGRDGTVWLIVAHDGQNVVHQFGKDGKSQRELRVPKDEPQPVEILASPVEDTILLRETGEGGLEQVRMLKRGAAQTEEAGRVVADWEVVFERTLQPCGNFGIVEGKLVADAGTIAQTDRITVPLVENALEPGKKFRLELRTTATNPGSVLTGPRSLALVEVSDSGTWKRFALVAGEGGRATLYQGDGLVVEEFAISQLDQIAAFDAGSFLLAPAGQ